jgi:hypothetical protein
MREGRWFGILPPGKFARFIAAKGGWFQQRESRLQWLLIEKGVQVNVRSISFTFKKTTVKIIESNKRK